MNGNRGVMRTYVGQLEAVIASRRGHQIFQFSSTLKAVAFAGSQPRLRPGPADGYFRRDASSRHRIMGHCVSFAVMRALERPGADQASRAERKGPQMIARQDADPSPAAPVQGSYW